MDDDRFVADALAVVRQVLDVKDIESDDAEDALLAAFAAMFTAAELDRLEKLFQWAGETAFLACRNARAREARTEAFKSMTDAEIREATGGSLLGTLAFRPPLVALQGGDAA